MAQYTLSHVAMNKLDTPCYRAALAALKLAGGRLIYSPHAWVPDEFETLEREGLVRCEFGFSDAMNPRLRQRSITFTDVGLQLSAGLGEVDVPRSYVRYSFLDALARSSAPHI